MSMSPRMEHRKLYFLTEIYSFLPVKTVTYFVNGSVIVEGAREASDTIIK